jgi:DNA-damage-inducible protein J
MDKWEHCGYNDTTNGGIIVATDTTVRARIDSAVKDEAAHVLDAMGLTVSDAIRMMLMRVAAEKALPFEVKIPNAETRAAMAELEAGKGRRGTMNDLWVDLNADD